MRGCLPPAVEVKRRLQECMCPGTAERRTRNSADSCGQVYDTAVPAEPSREQESGWALRRAARSRPAEAKR
ncbi:hypothetical protein NDU88_005234 [Pleurodeles waltl]|uniref:Uncharacterized protein n=1 Tax=Pleurodeles waltl TaxID=8319 RepID=A0AAV7NRM8_PLEWA|nr:hypothetical protein NDU88_005234 [Pleurodeles waltl]